MNSKLVLLFFFVFFTHAQIKVAFIINGDINDHGYSTSIYNGIQSVQAIYPNVYMYTSFNHTRPECPSVITSLVQLGFNLIILTDNVESCMLNAANTYPNVSFVLENNGTTFSIPNLAVMSQFGGIIKARYSISVGTTFQPGVKTVCFLTSKNFPNGVYQYSNAILQGYSTKHSKKQQLYVGLTNGFSNETSDEIMFYRLLNQFGCDIMHLHLNTDRAMQLSSDNHIYGIGYATDMRQYVHSEYVLSSVIIDWLQAFNFYITRYVSRNYTIWKYSYINDYNNSLATFSSYMNPKAALSSTETLDKVIAGDIDYHCGQASLNTYGTECTNDLLFRTAYYAGITVIQDD